MAKKGNSEESVDFSWAERYIEDRRFPKYVRIQTKFPRGYSRTEEGNIDFLGPEYARSYRGYIPGEDVDWNKLTVKPPQNAMSAKYRFVNNAKNGTNVPEGFYATSSGIFPIDFVPFTVGDTTGHPRTIVESGSVNIPGSGAEFLVARGPECEAQVPDNTYYPSYSGYVGRFEWEISPNFDNPTEPQHRFPTGARRKRTFRW